MRYICGICGYIYDEAKEKTPFASLPASWKCPLCGAGKGDFAPEGAPAPGSDVPMPAAGDPDLKKLSPGQLSVLFSNLARGCEKQYMPAEAALYLRLADYYASIAPAVEDADAEHIAAMLKADIQSYPAVRAAADREGDRGAARICVWGEKVTRMLSSLTERYLSEGEAMLKNTQVWICTVCGFVYIGETPPPKCPVCKVPARKFEKIEGRAG